MTTTLYRKLKDGTIKSWSTSGNWQGGKTIKNCEYCKEEFSVFNHRKDIARFCSRSCGASSRKGKDSGNWQGGIDYENKRARQCTEYEIWRNEVYRKYNWTCDLCDKKCRGKDIIAHHIKPFSKYPELRFDTDNGQTLCRSCHKKVHSEIGYETRFKSLTIA